ncbi:MAG: SpoIIE family protein phosphatase [Bacteroidales bacterium]|nr:SpoIIE family protein phosphatase [Bacteroidales bacterium]MDD4067865.1 SpoIIE family protein phosphatase [Bacteroidales bacterium]MDD4739251.1 SpoIIE family protein phosphatase [Bacteroidales bacterium]MDY4790042.1 SpoIIE family protein phosphatase [Bacteroidales bacterium]
MLSNTKKLFIEAGSFQQNKHGNIVCGDTVLMHKSIEENRTIAVVSDGLGSGVKANVLSTMTASMALNFSIRREPIVRTAKIIMDTLPIDSVRNISYATFSIIDIESDGNAKFVEYDNPPLILIRDGQLYKLEKEETLIKREANQIEGNDRMVMLSNIELQKEDRLICFSDGVSQSGIGNMTMPFGWKDGVNDFIIETLKTNPYISARELSRIIVKQSEFNDIFKPKDDTSCVVLYVREPRKLLICTGPPFKEEDDKYLAEIIKNYKGRKIVCGGTTSKIVSRELNLEIEVDLKDVVSSIPPVSKMKGIDLVTEGIITLGSLTEILENEIPHNIDQKGADWDIYRMILDADVIDIVAGTKINIAHQDPTLPVELEIRRNIVKKLALLLEQEYMKNVNLKFI